LDRLDDVRKLSQKHFFSFGAKDGRVIVARKTDPKRNMDAIIVDLHEVSLQHLLGKGQGLEGAASVDASIRAAVP
jgi:hypothetical protein